MYDLIVVGGGIVGLATARALLLSSPHSNVLLVEKELLLGSHQTGRNSGVIHSGIYYKPGSFKARLAAAGNRSMVAYCRKHEIPHQICGKVIVATTDAEAQRLAELHDRGLQNGVPNEPLTAEQLAVREPCAYGVAALWVPSTGIVDYPAVVRSLAEEIQKLGATIKTGVTVLAITSSDSEVIVRTTDGEYIAARAVNCGGLQSDRLVRSKTTSGAQIIPFRGEYYTLHPGRGNLVRGLIYPVPDPQYPFLGVHLTRGIGGDIHIGPNAVLGLAREGYRKTQVSGRDVRDMLLFPGFWKMTRRHWKTGVEETARSLSKALFVRAVQRLVPQVTAADLVPAEAGIRAQAVLANGALVDDFHFVREDRCLHVVNAPSPAATASLEIGATIVYELTH